MDDTQNNNPYSASDDVADDVPSRRVPVRWLFATSVIISLVAGLGLTGDAVPLFWAALLAGLPVLSFMAGHARRKEHVASVLAGILFAVAGIIAFVPVCIGIGTAAGMGIHSQVDPIVSLTVCTVSVGISCAIVIGLHHLRGVKEPTNAK